MDRIAKETGVEKMVVYNIIIFFFKGIKRIMLRNGEINLSGIMKIKLRTKYKKKLQENPDLNLFARKRRVYQRMYQRKYTNKQKQKNNG